MTKNKIDDLNELIKPQFLNQPNGYDEFRDDPVIHLDYFCNFPINSPKIHSAMQKVYESRIVDGPDEKMFFNQINELRKWKPASQVLETIFQSIREHMIKRRLKVYDSLLSLGLLIQIKRDNLHLIFQESFPIERRHSVDFISRKPENQKLSKRWLTNSTYIFSSIIDSSEKYLEFSRSFCQSYQILSQSSKSIEKLCAEIITSANFCRFPDKGNVHKCIFYKEIMEDPIISVLINLKTSRKCYHLQKKPFKKKKSLKNFQI